MKQINYTWEQVQGDCLELARMTLASGYKPDFIMGVSRGGMIPAVLISQFLGMPLYPITISLRDHKQPISYDRTPFVSPNTQILVVDDINDSGDTLTAIVDELPQCYIQTATLFEKTSSKFAVDYAARPASFDEWIVFPWEQFWIV